MYCFLLFSGLLRAGSDIFQFDLTPWVFLVTVAGVAIYKYLVCPFNLEKDLTDVGFGHLKRSKDADVSSARRKRRMGRVPPVYPNGWFMLAESSQIKSGKVKLVQALGENFAVYRTEQGQCRVLDAYCPHLGANMAVGGEVKGDCLQCPFHQWKFNGDGKLVNVPYSSKTPSLGDVKSYKVVETNDMIFIWYHAEGEEPTWCPQPIEEISSKRYVFRGRNQYLANSHIQDIPENGSDLWHFSAVHGAALLNGSGEGYKESVLFKFITHKWTSSWEPSTDERTKHTCSGHLFHSVSIGDLFSIAKMHVDIQSLGPGYVELKMKTDYGDFYLTQTVTPLEPMVQKIVHRIYSPRNIFNQILATITIKAESIMVERDVAIWNHKIYLDNPILLKEDKLIAKYRRWFSQFYSDHSPTLAQQEYLDW